MEESEDSNAGYGQLIYLIKINKQQKLPRRGKQADWLAGKAGLDRAGQGWTQTTSNIRYEPTRNCKHKEIIKGANYEGNEGKQLGKINQ